jgi:hypothetical protein
MSIDDFCLKNNLTFAQFARLIGYSQAMLCNVRKGRYKPGKRLIYQVKKVTKGQVDLTLKQESNNAA